MKNYSAQYQVQAECPQCGAAIILRETDFILHCEFCRTRVALYARDYFQYYIPPRDPIPDQVIYVPYWRFRGMCYFITAEQIVDTFYDTTFLAMKLPGFPLSLGVRLQVLPLQHVKPDIPGTFLKPAIPFRSVPTHVLNRVKQNLSVQSVDPEKSNIEFPDDVKQYLAATQPDTLDMGIFGIPTASASSFDNTKVISSHPIGHRFRSRFQFQSNPEGREIKSGKQTYHFHEFIGELYSLIYFPFYIRQTEIVDGVIHETTGSYRNECIQLPEKRKTFPRKVFSVISLQCPHCGWDLECERDSLMYHCRNCKKSWLFVKGELKRCRFRFEKADRPHCVHLPFWKLWASVDHVKQIHQSVSKAFVFDGGNASPDRQEISFFVPGIRIDPGAFLQVAHYLNANDFDPETTNIIEDSSRLIPLALPLNEAVESLPLIMAGMARFKSLYPHLADFHIKATRASVLYLPFIKQSIDLVYRKLNFSIRHADIRDVKELQAYLGE